MVNRWFHHVVTFGEGDPEVVADNSVIPGNAQTSTILLGEHLVIHVMSSHARPRIIKRWQLLPQIALKMDQIWPVVDRSVAWPPPGVLSEADVEAMANHFFIRVDEVVRRRKGLE